MDDRIIFGPAVIPGLKIYRNANKAVNEPHYILFTAQTIEQIRTKFHAKNYDNNVNIDHDGIQVQNVKLIQSFLLDDTNRTLQPKEFQDLPNGTWMIAYKIENEEIWDVIKNKKLNGFSIEGTFEYGGQVQLAT